SMWTTAFGNKVGGSGKSELLLDPAAWARLKDGPVMVKCVLDVQMADTVAGGRPVAWGGTVELTGGVSIVRAEAQTVTLVSRDADRATMLKRVRATGDARGVDVVCFDLPANLSAAVILRAG